MDRTSTQVGKAVPDGAGGFYAVAVLTLVVSFDTAWRFFGEVLGVTNWERPIMFMVVEAGLIACGYGMRAGVRSEAGKPGPARFWVWALCVLAGYMAFTLSGFIEGLARVALGPLLGLVMLHLALGIEVRAGERAKSTVWARVGRELRERWLSRLGLADDERDALARTRDRAALRAARLSLASFVLFRSARVARAVERSHVAHDEAARARMLAELAARKHADELAKLDQPSPWAVQRPSENAAHLIIDTDEGHEIPSPREDAPVDEPEATVDDLPAADEQETEVPESDPEPAPELAGRSKSQIIVDRLTELGAKFDQAAQDDEYAKSVRAMVPAATDWAAEQGVPMERGRGYDAVRREINRRKAALASTRRLSVVQGGEQ